MPATIQNPSLDGSVRVPAAHEPAADNIIAALAEALFSGEHYEIIERSGELFVQPVLQGDRSRGMAAVFSPDARAQREAIAMAA